jgi:hypothetical protein
VLNDRRNDHPISPATVRKLGEGADLSCQHALFLLRWLEVPPEAFIAKPIPGTAGVALPVADEAHRLRWNLRKLYESLNAAAPDAEPLGSKRPNICAARRTNSRTFVSRNSPSACD